MVLNEAKTIKRLVDKLLRRWRTLKSTIQDAEVITDRSANHLSEDCKIIEEIADIAQSQEDMNL